MAHDVFISYSSKDREVAKAICAFLEEKRIRCFVDYRDITGGVNYGAALVQAVESCHLMVLLFSSHSNQSKEIDKELTLAAKYGKPILPFKLVDEPYVQSKEYHLVDRHWIDAFPQPERHFNQLLTAVTALLGPTLKEPPPLKLADSSLELGLEHFKERDEILFEPHLAAVSANPPPLPDPVLSHIPADAPKVPEPMDSHEPVEMEPATPRKRKWVVVAMLTVALVGIVILVRENSSGLTVRPWQVIYGTMTDSRDGQTYKTVRIGSQVWMAENLNYAASSDSWCYNNEASSCSRYGRLYDWQTAKSACPESWHLPSDGEWTTLTDTALSPSTAGFELKSTSEWNNSDNGTDAYGFRALPAGYRFIDGTFIGGFAGFWTASEVDESLALSRYFSTGGATVKAASNTKSYGYSLRCIQD